MPRLPSQLPPLAVLALLGTLALSSMAVLVRPPPPAASMAVWMLAPEQADAWAASVETFQQRHGAPVHIQLMPASSLDLRLMMLLRGGADPQKLPDVVHIEILSAAKLLDGPPEQIPFIPLEDRLAAAGLLERLPAASREPWQRHGHLYGVPLDIHPVTLTYRRDLFEAAGLDPSQCQTWSELAVVLDRYCDHLRRTGRPHARALELARTRSDHLTLMLQQRGIELVDASGRPRLHDPRIAVVVSFYVELLAGKRPVAMPTSEGHGRWARELARGDVAMAWTPQWRLERLEAAAPELAGKLAMMPLPRFEAGDARTAVWGGSMLAIPRGAPDPEASWALLRHLALDEGSLAASVAGRPAEAFYDRQDTRVLYRALEAEAPPQRVTPLDLAASGHLAAILSRAADARRAGVSGERLEGLLRQWLGDAQADLERRARFTD